MELSMLRVLELAKLIKDVLIRMKIKNGVSLDDIQVELWKSLGDEMISWLIRLFNRIQHSRKILDK